MSDLIRRADAVDAVRKTLVGYIPCLFGRFEKIPLDTEMAIRKVPSAISWIPCSIAQPKQNGEYLVTLQFKWAKEIDIGEWLDGRWIGLYADDIVAWMDLPMAWEEGLDEA